MPVSASTASYSILATRWEPAVKIVTAERQIFGMFLMCQMAKISEICIGMLCSKNVKPKVAETRLVSGG
jgi:hypothetical protein